MALILGSNGVDHLVGTKFADTIYGYGEDDGIFAGAGNDTVSGGGGDDIIGNDYGDDFLDGGADTDTVTFNYVNQQNKDLYPNAEIGVVFDLAIQTQQDLGAWGKDTIKNFENVGGSLANDKLYGNGGVNVMNGDVGADVVDGRAGNDWVAGGWGKDAVVGGAGADHLFGNGPSAGDDHNRDRFDFFSIADSGMGIATRDQIYGYFGSSAGKDRINLSMIDANPFVAGNQAFKFIGSAGFTGEVGEVRCIKAGNDIRVVIDVDNDVAGEMSILVHDVAQLHAYDFIL